MDINYTQDSSFNRLGLPGLILLTQGCYQRNFSLIKLEEVKDGEKHLLEKGSY